MAKLKQTGARVPISTHRRLIALADLHGMSMGAVIAQLVEREVATIQAAGAGDRMVPRPIGEVQDAAHT